MQVAEEIYEAFVQNKEILGINMKDLVSSTGHSLKSYMVATEENQWASRVKVAMGAATLSIVVEYGEPGYSAIVGNGNPNYRIQLIKEHLEVFKAYGRWRLRENMQAKMGAR